MYGWLLNIVFRGIYNFYCQSTSFVSSFFGENESCCQKNIIMIILVAPKKKHTERIRQNLILITGGGVDVEQLITNNFQLNWVWLIFLFDSFLFHETLINFWSLERHILDYDISLNMSTYVRWSLRKLRTTNKQSFKISWIILIMWRQNRESKTTTIIIINFSFHSLFPFV